MVKKLLLLLWISPIFNCAIMLAQSSKKIPPDTALLQSIIQLQKALDEWNKKKMLQARATFEQLLAYSNDQWLVHYYIALSDLYLTQYHLSSKEKDEVKKYIKDGIENLERSIKLKENFADSYALLANLYGMEISLSPTKGIILGPRINSVLATAEKLEPNNPRVHLVAGISAFHTPKLFGGGEDKAIQRLNKAAELFETYQPPSPLYPNWGHEEVYAWLGLIAMKQNDFELAEKYFNKALKINPNYFWVKYVLLPQLKEKQN